MNWMLLIRINRTLGLDRIVKNLGNEGTGWEKKGVGCKQKKNRTTLTTAEKKRNHVGKNRDAKSETA